MKYKSAILLLLATLLSCTREYGLEEIDMAIAEKRELTLATFGAQTGHPFSIENAKKAYNHLPLATRAAHPEESIIPTHKYIRFMPLTEEELWNVRQRQDIDVFQYPLDCEVTEGFVGIDNPFLVDGFPQLWSVVSQSFPLHEIDCHYELESELWMPDITEEVVKSSPYSGILSFYEELMKELCKEQNVAYDDSDLSTKAKNTYTPGGRVRYNDTSLGATPLEGMRVEAYTFWHNYKAISTSTGYLNFGGKTFKGDFKYRVKFSREDFALRKEDNKSDLEYVTSNTTSQFNQTFTGEYAKYCVIFQAAQRYYYQSLSIPRPPMNSFWKACLRIHVFPNESGEYLGAFTRRSRFILADRPEIYIYGKSNQVDRMSDQLYGTTIHELAHAMHYSMNKGLYKSIELSVLESLARGVQLYLTQMRYPSYVYEMHSGYYTVNLYTAFMRDLTDPAKHVFCYQYANDYNDFQTYTSAKTYYDNVVSAFTYPELVEAVETCRTPLEWKNRIKLLYPGRVSDADLDGVYTYWFTK